MSWFETIARIAALGGLAISAAGCGFEPLYAERDPVGNLSSELATVRVAQIGERYGQIMTNELHDSLNPHAVRAPAAYELSIGLKESRANIASRADGTASRSTMQLMATWTLRRLSDSAVVTQGIAKAQGGHDVLFNEYANVVSDNTDEARAVKDCAEQIETRVAIYIQSLHDPK
jgi:LPS-assembly lipoprotein